MHPRKVKGMLDQQMHKIPCRNLNMKNHSKPKTFKLSPQNSTSESKDNANWKIKKKKINFLTYMTYKH
jgi:hypothetical protein